MGLSGSRDGKSTPTGMTPAQLAALNDARCQAALHNYGRSDAGVGRMDGLMPIVLQAAAKHGIDPRTLAAVGVRETDTRNIPQRGGGGGAGIFQLTSQPPAVMARAYDIPFAADYAAHMLANSLRYVEKKWPHFTDHQKLEAQAVGYNHWFGGFKANDTPQMMEKRTAGQNYGQSVLDLMNCFPKIPRP